MSGRHAETARTRAGRLTFRWRLTLAFGGTAFGAGALVITLLYLFMRYVPTYFIASAVPTDPSEGFHDAMPLSTVEPAVPVGGAESVTAASAFAITDVASILDALLWGGIAILVLLAAIAAVVGWIVAGRMLRPLARIGDAAHRAGEGALDHRIALEGPRDEIRDLADTFDRTLDRLERAFTAHERFAANAAHELRTPLAATKTLLDVAAAHPGAVDPGEVIEEVRRNNDRSIGLVQALLNLTSIESAALVREEVDLAALAATALASVRPGAVDAVLSRGEARTSADRALLDLLVVNLVHNAVRHNDERGVVLIATGADGGRAWLRVENTGPVVRPEEIDKLTEPLYRSRRAAGAGHGLGLAIARSVAEVHRADLLLAPRPGGGLVVVLRMPERSAAEVPAIPETADLVPG